MICIWLQERTKNKKHDEIEATDPFYSLEKERTEGGRAEKNTIPSSDIGECPGYK